MAKKRKNILLLWLDGLRADRLGCYGYNRGTSPTIDRLASSGATFLNNYSVSNSTIPAYYSIGTGLYPAVHKAASTSGYYDGSYPFITDLLRDAGYFTFGIGNNVAGFSPEWGFIRGYDRFFRIGKIQNWFKESKEAQRGFNKRAIRKTLVGTVTKINPRLSDWARTRYADNYYRNHDMGGAKAVEVFDGFIEDFARNENGPLFGYINIPEAHSPYLPPYFCRKKFGNPTITPPLLLANMFPTEFEKRGLALTDNEIEDLAHLYDGSVGYVDALVDKIVGSLRRVGLFEDTVLFMFGDHGGNLFEKKGYLGAASYSYDAEIKVPLIVVNADGLNGRFSRLTSLIDIFPTILEIAGLEGPAGDQYRCKNLLRDNEGHDAVLADYPKWPDWLLQHDPDLSANFFFKYGIINRTMICKDGWKLIWRNDGAHELYDLKTDPAENINKFSDERKRAYELIHRMKRTYTDLLGEAGQYPEIYDHHSVGPGMKWLPQIESINHAFDPVSVVYVDNPEKNDISSVFRT